MKKSHYGKAKWGMCRSNRKPGPVKIIIQGQERKLTQIEKKLIRKEVIKMNEKTINALVFAPRNWVSKANAKFNQESDKEMLSYDFINLDNGKLGNFSCEATAEAIEKIGMANVAYSDLSKSPVRIFQLDYIMKTSGLNEYANFSKARSVAELFHYEIKK